MLDIHNLSKFYGKKKALNNINLEIEKGQIVGLLGPSGSGKTTLFNIAAGIMPFKEGEIRINSLEPSEKTKAFVSILTENNAIPKWMKVKDIVHFYNEMYDDFNKEKFDNILNNFDLDIPYKKRIKNLSKGMTQLLRLALTISREAELYLLDEPLGGMDTLLRDKVIDIILDNLNTESTTIIATHIIPDVERMLDKVVFIKDGSILGYHDCEELRISKGKSVENVFKEVMI
ncbi:ABC transporter ATP-binding protein [Oceanirhabdus sp. W0125-5]|uniref:ABC transporter ATP-binding protein n=1 Tax=Oceanirhabdus sp. W0125-5 TaxID=2999116 RepID=UPI0022F321DA|nr:ABC transporter ATP-binding protein [Oceanirhabdus sp. W0125-5]WBW94886.1 ABC transporter ATP-binding protein [Oceanirhabdus sp. W0125-5]